MATDLHTKYRPTTLEDIVGQDAIVKSLRAVLKRKSTHAFLFTGPAGTGKTTLGRLIALAVGSKPHNIIEVDAATNSGIDAMRSVTEGISYASLGGSNKTYIIDEAHALSGAAWQSLLKVVEEPPEHVYWVFCTTNATKVPETIKTRCSCYTLSTIRSQIIFDVLKSVAEKEGYKTPEEVLDYISQKVDGSLRRGLTCLAQCVRCVDRKEAAELMKAVAEDSDIADLCRGLHKGNLTWEKACEVLKAQGEVNGESIRYMMLGWFTKVALDTPASKAASILAIIEAFKEPYPPNSNVAHVLLSLGGLLLPN